MALGKGQQKLLDAIQDALIEAQKEIENKEPEESQDDLCDGVLYAAEFIADDVFGLGGKARENFLSPLDIDAPLSRR